MAAGGKVVSQNGCGDKGVLMAAGGKVVSQNGCSGGKGSQWLQGVRGSHTMGAVGVRGVSYNGCNKGKGVSHNGYSGSMGDLAQWVYRRG